jgi:hypothetical protein
MKQQTRSLFETEYRNRQTPAWGLSGEQLFDEMNRAHPSTVIVRRKRSHRTWHLSP